jgi:hypothetical protein
MFTAISRGAGCAAHDAPLAPGREAGAAQAAQDGRLQRLAITSSASRRPSTQSRSSA